MLQLDTHGHVDSRPVPLLAHALGKLCEPAVLGGPKRQGDPLTFPKFPARRASVLPTELAAGFGPEEE